MGTYVKYILKDIILVQSVQFYIVEKFQDIQMRKGFESSHLNSWHENAREK